MTKIFGCDNIEIIDAVCIDAVCIDVVCIDVGCIDVHPEPVTIIEWIATECLQPFETN